MPEKRRILLADDEPSIIKMVGKRLELEGFEVLVAVDGEEALTKAQTARPDLILLDVMLPKLNGYEVCTRLKQDVRYQQIPIVIFTVKGRREDLEMAKECGADAHVRKPFQPQDLLKEIQRLIAASPKAEDLH